MTVIALASAKGSPGATMAGLALASVWPREVVLADVDPAGGDLIWRSRTPSGDPLDPDRGLLSLGAAARRGAAETTLASHLQDSSLGRQVLVGVSSPEQLTGLGAVWSQLSAVFDAHSTDVLVDCGRVVPGSPALPVLLKSDVVLFVTRPDLAGIAHLRERLRSLSAPLRLGQAGGTLVAIALATSYRDTRTVADLQRLLDSERLFARVLGIVADDPKAARLLSSERIGDPRRTLLGRSARSLADQLVAVQSNRRDVGAA